MAKCSKCGKPDAVTYSCPGIKPRLLCSSCIDAINRQALEAAMLKDPPYRPTMRPEWQR